MIHSLCHVNSLTWHFSFFIFLKYTWQNKITQWNYSWLLEIWGNRENDWFMKSCTRWLWEIIDICVLHLQGLSWQIICAMYFLNRDRFRKLCSKQNYGPLTLGRLSRRGDNWRCLPSAKVDKGFFLLQLSLKANS